MAAYVLIETALLLAGTVWVVRKLADSDRRRAVLEPAKPAPSADIAAYTAHDRITARQRPYVHAGIAFEDINTPTSLHLPQSLLNRTQNPSTRALTGDEHYYGVKDPHRRAFAMARAAVPGASSYWSTAAIKS